MPAQAPALAPNLAAQLTALGEGIRRQRQQQKVSATTAAEAAGMSRVTLHRIERGEPSVTMGAYLSALAAVGLQLEAKDPRAAHGLAPAAAAAAAAAPVRLADYPQLQRLAWQRPGVTELSAQEALAVYERNWRHVAESDLAPSERALIDSLVVNIGGGRLLV